ncbi:MAG TPA: hypothetical protein VJ951_03590 [Bacteroidales bacterium]|nr:hypothetical protein [Bacteroidales bacterium]
MRQVLIIIIIILPIVLLIIWVLRNRDAKGYIEESSLNRIIDKEAFIKELRNLCSEKKWSLQLSDNEAIIRTGITLWSLGEIISIKFAEMTGEKQIKVISKPKIKTTRIDYNKNKKNIDLIRNLQSVL